MNFILEMIAKVALKEILVGLLERIPWAAITERLVTRIVIAGLEKLRDMDYNDVTNETVDDMIRGLRGKRLKRADEMYTSKGD